MNVTTLPLWAVGFRPFFALACLSGALLPLLWIMMYSGSAATPATFIVSAQQWHAHEMFFGFGWAVLGGFLLTASKNWVSIRGYHGTVLIALVAAWCLERVGMVAGQSWPPVLFWFSNLLFGAMLISLLVATLVRHRKTDSYPDNLYFILLLPCFLPAKWLILSPETFTEGWGMTLGLFRLSFLLMLERTLPAFMKGAFQVNLRRIPWCEHIVKTLALLLVFGPFLPVNVQIVGSLVLAVMLLTRWLAWYPLKALSRLEIGIMYLGYLLIVAQLLIEALGHISGFPWVGNVSVHVFALGVIGLVTPAMILRISKGHTGRKVVFDHLDKTCLWMALAGFMLRVVAPQMAPDFYLLWLMLSASCWLFCFGLLGWRYIPWLFQARVDGKEH
ncbi:MAG: hypothetical protein RIR18_844 [Pseudomonadota bacterium]